MSLGTNVHSSTLTRPPYASRVVLAEQSMQGFQFDVVYKIKFSVLAQFIYSSLFLHDLVLSKALSLCQAPTESLGSDVLSIITQKSMCVSCISNSFHPPSEIHFLDM